MPNPATVEPRVEAALMSTFSNIEMYLLNALDDLHEGAGGLLVADEHNIRTMEQVWGSLRMQMESLGFQNVRIVQMAALQELNRQVVEEAKKWKTEQVDPSFTQRSQVQIGIIMQGAERELIQVADQASAEITQLLQRAVLGGSSQADLIKRIMTQLQIREDQALTLARTTLHSFNSFTTTSLAESVGVEEFALEGPNELRSASHWTSGNVIRNWCWHWEGRRGTWVEIEATTNQWGREKQPPGAKIWRGGWNCRHRWRPVFASERKQFEKGPRAG